MTDIVVQDNFLDEEYFKRLQSKILVIGENSFPWFMSYTVTGKPYQMCHVVYGNHRSYSDFYGEFGMLFDALKVFQFIRIKINLLNREEKIIEHGMHTDIQNAPENVLTSILYMNTNNGYTKFETGEKIESVENRLVTFPNSLKHTGSTNNCDALYRCVMNIDWIKEGINK